MTRAQLRRRVLPSPRVVILMNGPTREYIPLASGPYSLWCQGFMRSFVNQADVQPTMWWDPHNLTTMQSPKRWDADYLGHLQESTVPVLLREVHPQIPKSVAYPLAQVVAWIRSSYAVPWAGGLDYLILLAGYLGASDVTLCGCDYDSPQERMYQTFGAAHAIGILTGRGINVHLAPGSPLLWNIVPGDYGLQFPPWPYADDPRHPRWQTPEALAVETLLKRATRDAY